MSFAIPFTPTDPPAYFPPKGAIKGDWSPQLQLQKLKYDPCRGYVYIYQWKGASQDLIVPLMQDLINAGMAVECSFERDMAILEVVDSTSEYTIDSWEILATEETRDLFSHPAIVSAIAGVVGAGAPSSDVYKAIRTNLANEAAWAVVTHDPTLAPVVGDGTAGPLLLDFYTLYGLGTTGYRRQAYVLKHKTNVSNRWDDNVADVGIDNIYSPAALLSEVESSNWIFPLPPRLQYKLGQIPNPSDDSTPDNYLWGWLKSSSTETTEALNRVNIETSYALDLWDINIYPAYEG